MGTGFPVNKPSFFQHRLRQWLPASALCVGLLVGRSMRHESSVSVETKGGGSVSRNEVNGHSVGADGSQGSENADNVVEAEVARLLGGNFSSNGRRTAQQSMDAISAAWNEKSDLRRFLAIYEAANELGRDDIGDALTRARSEGNPIAVRALERRWGEVDPLGAMNALKEGKTTAPGDAFFSAWAKSNPAGALGWYASLEDGDLKNQARVLLLERVATLDPQRALDFANQLPEGKDQSQLVSRALMALGGRDSAEALTIAQRLPEGAARRAGIDSVVSQLAGKSVEEAQKVMAELPPNTLTNASAIIGAALLRESPEKAFEWAGGLPEGASKDSLYGGIAREWASRDVEAAAAWLDTLPKGSARDAAVASFASRSAPRDPEGATMWAATLEPGAQRSSALGQTVGIWLRLNPAAANEWITNAPGLSAEERESLAKQPAQRFDPRFEGRVQPGRRPRF